MKSLVLTLLAIMLFSTPAFAGLIKKIKKNRFLFSIEGLENVKKGSWVIVETDEGKKVYAKVLKKGKRSALAQVRKSKDRKRISVGNDVTLKDRSNKYNDTDPNLGKGKNGFFIEPFINAYISTFEQKITYTGTEVGTGTISSSSMGFDVGTLIGYKFNRFYISPNISLSKGTISSQEYNLETNLTSLKLNLEDETFTKNTIGLYGGYQITSEIRMWLTANIISLETVTPSEVKTIYKGMSFSAGANYELKKNFFVNLSVGMSQYNDKDGEPLPREASVGVTEESIAELQFLGGFSYYFSFAK